MRLKAIFCAGAMATAALVLGNSPAAASSDDGCETIYTVDQSHFGGCANFTLLTMSPAADTRMTLWMLLMDQKNDRRMPRADAGDEDRWRGNGWNRVMTALLPPVDPDTYSRVSGIALRCNSNSSGATAFIAAVRSARGISEADKTALIAGRNALSQWCGDTNQREEDCPSWNRDRPECTATIATPGSVTVSGGEAREFAAYLAGAAAFYQSDFATAARAFASQSRARNAWVKEAALYMVARTELNAMQTGLFDRWGGLNNEAARAPGVSAKAEAAFNAYFAAYRQGRYTASGKGLMRRVYWLSGQTQKLAALYDEAARAGGGNDVIAFVNEVDLKLLADREARFTLENPVMLATVALARMRATDNNDYDRGAMLCCQQAITRQELDAMHPRFAGQEALFDFLIANHDMYVAHQPRAVLSRIADASRSPRFNHLDFSRQFLRGLALDAARDAGAEVHWRAMLRGAAAGYQQQAVELALASHLERAGKIAELFNGNAPLSISPARENLLMNVADAPLLRQLMNSSTLSARDRSIAGFTLLYKRLTRGEFAEFGRDLAAVRGAQPQTDENRVWRWSSDTVVPIGLFSATLSDANYRCPALPQIAQQLAANPRNVRASMCLADFTRLAGFDSDPIDVRPLGSQLGGSRPAFPIGSYNRMGIYQRVIADRTASADDRAYALYRAVYCFAPSGYNTCGGAGEIPQSQRRTWFNQLKRDYPNSHWARELRYYW